MRTLSVIQSAVVKCLVLAGIAVGTAHADTFNATYLAAGVQTPSGITSYYNTFESPLYNSTTQKTTFNGSGITGTYSGGFTISGADQFGGAGGTGNYITTGSAASYTLSLSSSANYFGLWFSALDAGNLLSFYKDSTLLYSFTPSYYQTLVGSCPNTSNAYCGNPNTAFRGQDAGEQFAYLNFYDTNGTFNKITFSGGGFESDNHAVALLANTTTQAGTQIVTPEPSSLVLLLTGVGIIGMMLVLKRASRQF